jgi:hypothetical protein
MGHFSGYGAYMLYLAMRTHFNNNTYDFFQMKGIVRANRESYNKRADKAVFAKIARDHSAMELKDFYISNLLDDKYYIAELLNDDAKDCYNQYLARRQSLTYNFTGELDKIFKHGLKEPFTIYEDRYPYIINLYLGKMVSHETMIVMENLLSFSEKFDKYLGEDDVIWSKISLKIRKYKPFLKYDKNKFKSILKEKVNGITTR